MTEQQNAALTLADFSQPPPKEKRELTSRRNWFRPDRAPPFSWWHIDPMCQTPRVVLGLLILHGVVSKSARFSVRAANPKVVSFIQQTLRTFWNHVVPSALCDSLKYGFACGTLEYEYVDGTLVLKGYANVRDPRTCRPIVHPISRNLHSFRTTGTNSFYDPLQSKDSNEAAHQVQFPCAFWTVHNRHIHRWYGESALYGAYFPWLEYEDYGGGKDIQRQFWYRLAFDGGTLMYEPGMTMVNGNPIDNREIAHKIMESKRTGAPVCIPNVNGPNGLPKWQLLPPNISSPPPGLSDYISGLEDRMLEGMGIPPEVLRASDWTGALAGRQVPMTAFEQSIFSIVCHLCTDLKEQCLDPLIHWNFGSVDYDISATAMKDATDPDGKPEAPQAEQPAPEALPAPANAPPPNRADKPVAMLPAAPAVK